MEHIEYEERVLISENDYKKVIEDMQNNGHECHPFTIENIYLDSKKHKIIKNDMMLRIRNTSNGVHELTLKIKNPGGGHIEINETLDSHPQIDEYLNHKFEKYKEITRLITERIEIPFDDYLFVIDKNSYSGIVDYNIEVESSSQEKAVQIAKEYCEKYGIEYTGKCKSKSKRAFQALKKG